MLTKSATASLMTMSDEDTSDMALLADCVVVDIRSFASATMDTLAEACSVEMAMELICVDMSSEPVASSFMSLFISSEFSAILAMFTACSSVELTTTCVCPFKSLAAAAKALASSDNVDVAVVNLLDWLSMAEMRVCKPFFMALQTNE